MKNSIKTILLTFVILFAGLSLTAGNTAKAFEVQPTVLTNLEIVNNQVAVSEKFTIVVMDMQGEVVTFEVVSGNEELFVLDCSSLVNGMYQVKIMSREKDYGIIPFVKIQESNGQFESEIIVTR